MEEFIEIEIPIAWEEGKNLNNYEIPKDLLFDSIKNRLSGNTFLDILPYYSDDTTYKNDLIIGNVIKFNQDNRSVICNVLKEKCENIYDLCCGFAYVCEMDGNNIINNIKDITYSVFIKKSESCYNK